MQDVLRRFADFLEAPDIAANSGLARILPPDLSGA
jgi:hypothetical protein